MIHALGLLLLALSALIFLWIIRLWPAEDVAADNFWSCAACDAMPFEVRMLLLVLLAGALGSIAHTATSFASYVGNRKFELSWLWWYFLRVPIGMGLALILYFLLRGGFFSPATGNIKAENVVNPFGFAGIAALAGMFSKQATDKLKELFDGLFRTDEDELREDKLDSLTPQITKLEPAEVAVGEDGITLKVTGARFTKESKIHVNGNERETNFTSNKELICVLEKEDTAIAGQIEVTVVLGDEDGTVSRGVQLVVK